MRLNIKKIIPSFRIHAIIDGALVASSGYDIYMSRDEGESWKFCNTLPIGRLNKYLSTNRLTSRLFRAGISQIVSISKNKNLIYCNYGMYISDSIFSHLELVNLPSHSFQLLDNSICVTPNYIYFSEYIPNIKREKVNIFRSNNGLNWEIIYSFPEKSAKHMHVMQYDAKSNMIWFSTGDADNECFLGFSDSEFSDITIIGNGSQKWRSLEFLFTDDNVFWGMDTPETQSKLLSYSRTDQNLVEIFNFPGPIYNIKKFNKGFLIITAKEGGKSEWDNYVHLWYSSDLHNWENCISYKKDRYPYFLGFGRLLLCRNLCDSILFSGYALNGIDNKLVIGEIEC